jgi:hypothetical protein
MVISMIISSCSIIITRCLLLLIVIIEIGSATRPGSIVPAQRGPKLLIIPGITVVLTADRGPIVGVVGVSIRVSSVKVALLSGIHVEMLRGILIVLDPLVHKSL